MDASQQGAENSDYLQSLAAALADEIEHVATWCPSARELMLRCRQLEGQIQSLKIDDSLTDWRRGLDAYGELARAVAGRLNAVSNIARSYDSMDEFWSDADAQSAGASPFTFWDTYEHGRRRQIERVVADVYGAEDALLLNTGMSAVTAAIEAAGLRPGDRLLTGLYSYFETSEYIEKNLSLRGIEILRVPIGNPDAMRTAIAQSKPRLILFETTTNAPDAAVPLGLEAWLASRQDALVVCDNTVQGPLTRWFSDPELAGLLPAQFLVVESATKYLSQSVMAGIVYGKREQVDRARAFARVTGQQLQEKAFNHLRNGNLLHVGRRLKLHSRNTELVADELSSRCGGAFAVRLLSGSPRARRDRPDLFSEGVGGIVFLVPRDAEGLAGTAPAICRRVLSSWRDRLGAIGYPLRIRAGFGWNETSARIYETGALNQPDAPAYLRISIGIEPKEVARQFGATLCEAVEANS